MGNRRKPSIQSSPNLYVFTFQTKKQSTQTMAGHIRSMRAVAFVLLLNVTVLSAIAASTHRQIMQATSRPRISRLVDTTNVTHPLLSVRLDIGPLRQFWPEHHGYCGEMSIQQAAAYHGHWVSQRAARWLAGGEVLFSQYEGETILPLVRDQLGFNFTHFRRIPVADGGLQEYLIWMKENLAAGLPVIFVARLKNGETLAPGSYDHIMPMYGFTSHSVSTFEPTDRFVWTSGTRNEIVRSVSTPGFFGSGPKSCIYNLTEGGCINSNNQTHNYGMGIAGLFDADGVFLPMQLNVTDWEDGTAGDREPRDGDVKGEYTLNLTRAGNFSVGEAFTVYKFVMARGRHTDDVITSGHVLSNITTAQAVDDLCTLAEDACRSHTFHVVVTGPQVVAAAEQWLGHIRANSVVFFVAVRVDRAAAFAVGLASG